MELSQTNSSDPRKTELLELQKQHKHMELDRRAYAEESQALLRKQQTNIDKLRKENDAIKGEISMFMRSSSKPMSNMQQEAIHKMHDQGDKYANAIEFEKRNLEVMEDQISIMKQKCLHQRRAMGGINASKDNFYMIQKQIRILENRLDKALIKFNEAIAHNKTLRDDIDDLRRERVVFENIYRKMERELQERKQKMAEIIETSNLSYEQRDTYQMEIAAIEQANRKEQEEFEEQMTELARMLETEFRLPVPGASTKRLATSASAGQIRDLPTQGDGQGSPAKGGLYVCMYVCICIYLCTYM
jgi:tetratricopeptide (TPR) repeat protein